MRFAPALLLAPILASCAATPPPPSFDPYGAARLNAFIGGKVAGAPSRCLPFRASNVQIINSNAIGYDAGAQTYVNHLQGSCGNITRGNYTIVTRPFGFGGPCRGDLAYLVDSSGMTVGSCVLGDFVPYRSRR